MYILGGGRCGRADGGRDRSPSDGKEWDLNMEQKNQPAPPVRIGPPGRGGPPHAGMLGGEKPKDGKKTLKRLAGYLSDNRLLFFALIGAVVAITLLNLAVPSIQGRAINMLAEVLTGAAAALDRSGFLKTIALLAAAYGALAVFTYIQVVLSTRLSQLTVRNLRRDLFAKILYLPIRYFDTHRHGDIMSRMTNDVENIANIISQSVASLVSGVLTLVGTVAVMLWYSPLLTLISMVTVLLVLLTTKIMSKYMRSLFREQQLLLGELNAHAEETITGCKTIAAYSEEEARIEEFLKISERFKTCSIKAQLLGGSMGPIMNVISNIGFFLIAAFGGYFAWRGMITVGVIQAFIIYAKQFSRPINELANQYANIQTAMAGAERVFEIMDFGAETDDGKRKISVHGSISFENVDFSYKNGEPVLRGFNLDIKQGQKLALVGATGSGKTTVVNLLTRFYDVDSGSIKLDGVDIRDIKKSDLRNSIAIVLQDTVLFSDTVENNIRFGNSTASASEVETAAETANAETFIDRLPDGYNTLLSESGTNLSQGQRQLLSIARAALKDPAILILDEATSSVDTRTEMNIQQAMLALMKNRTCIIIAHRLSTIRDADKIVVLNNGVIEETGSSEELLRRGGAYAALYKKQFMGEES